MGLYTTLIRPMLFTLPPERAQAIAEAVLGITPLWKAARPFLETKNERLHCDMGGITLANPVGLAAGYDKDCRLVGRLANLGFGYIVVGTVVAGPRKGNPVPRLVRDPGRGSLTNSLGFPSRGLEPFLESLQRVRPGRLRVLASISGVSVEEFSRCHEAVQPLVSGLELNISSPNTEGVRIFQEPRILEELLASLGGSKEKPLYVKLPPYFDEVDRGRIMELVDVCLHHAVEGITVVNTWPREDARLAVGRGGVSGKPLFPHMLRIVADVRQRAGERLIINACGGVFSGEDAVNALLAGANTVQLFTGFVYQGPGVAAGINRHIVRYIEKKGITSVRHMSPSLPG